MSEHRSPPGYCVSPHQLISHTHGGRSVPCTLLEWMSRSYVIIPLEHSNLPKTLVSFLYMILRQFWHFNVIWLRPLFSLWFNWTNKQGFRVLSGHPDNLLNLEVLPLAISTIVSKRIGSILRQPRWGGHSKTGKISSENCREALLLAKKTGQSLGVWVSPVS